MSITIAMLMEQAQIFASSWALVGTPLAQVNQLKLAEEEKERLEEMLEEFQEQIDLHAAPGNLKEIAEGLIQWHQNKLSNFDTVLAAPKDTEIRLGTGDNPMILEGERAKGFRIGVMIAREWIETFPLSITPSAPSDEEE